MRDWLVAASVSLVLTTALVETQDPDPSQETTFRGGVDFVRVDMSASRDGRPVTDLQPEEIQIWEDGVLQSIGTFERVSVPSGGPEATRVEPNSIRAGLQMAADPRARVFVVFLDSVHLEAQFAQQLRDPLRRFLEEALGPDDLVALMTPEMTVRDLTFTRRTTVLSQLMDETGEWMLRDLGTYSIDDTELMYRWCYPATSGMALVAQEMIARRRETMALDALEALSIHLGQIREERKTVLLPTMGWQLFEPNEGLASAGAGERGGFPIAPLLGNTDDQRLAQCSADRMALAAIDHRDRLDEITGEANRNNVSFYPITPLRVERTLGQLSALRELAQDTDGMSIVNTNNIAEPMQRIIADTSFYYLLGYQSSKPPDGSDRTIRIAVSRPGVEVRARRGYRSLPAEAARRGAIARAAAATPRPEDPVARAFNEVARTEVPVPLRVRASPWTRQTAAGPEGRIWIVGEVDADERRREPGWSAGAQAEVIVLGPDGRQLRRAIEVPKGASAFAADASGDRGPLPAGTYDVRVSIQDAGGNGSLTETTRVDVAATPAPFGDALLLRGGASARASYAVTADPRFRRNERLRLELPTASNGPVQAQVLDRTGQAMQVSPQVTERPDVSGAFRWIVVDLPLAPFAAADYAIAVTQDGAAKITAFRVTQ